MSSFLNAVLSSIGGNDDSKASATTTKITTPNTNTKDAHRKDAKPTDAIIVSTLKRKAEPLPTPLPAKIPRTEITVSRTTTGVLPSRPKLSPAATAPSVRPGSVRPGLINSSSSAMVSKNTGPSAKSPLTNSPMISSNVKPPPKGSYREILARAEAAKAAQAEFGQIKHKPVPKDPKLSRKERMAQEMEAAQKARQEVRPGKVISHEIKLQSGIRPNIREAELVREKKKPMDLGYRGTMRPAPLTSTNKGPMEKSISTPARREGSMPGKSVPKRPPDSVGTSTRYKYASYSDEEDEGEEEDYDDESDMEAAGFDELEEEEQQSLKAARKEDEEALREESEHKRIKAEKRKKLEQLIAARRK